MAQSLPVLNFYENVRKVLALQARHDYIHYVKVFEHELLHSGQRIIHSNVKQNFILYSAIMEKLMPLSHDEDKLFKTICDAVEAGKSGAHIKKLISEQNNWLNFNLNRCQIFLDQIERSVIIHRDFQRQNVMKDALGNFKLIDFDFSKIKEPTYEASRSECAE
jgi:thiamine kinase-like enzyme